VNQAAALDLQRQIHRAIPLSRAMGYRITELADARITVEAPLEPNINIHGSGFAGSLYALGILSAWGLCTHIISQAAIAADLVVAKATIDYRAPVRGGIACHCSIADADALAFVESLRQRSRARISLEVAVGRAPDAVIHAIMHGRCS
jgi:thioesterase domain-containing protein